MKELRIVIEEPKEGEEEQILIRCREMSPEILRAISIFKSQDAMVAYEGNEIYRIKPSDIYYIEVVDNKTFVYEKKKVYESKQKLYELEEALSAGNFLRASKSVLLNLMKIRSLSPAFSGRFEALLDNGEKVVISRQYIGDLKKRLGI
ncbi:LytTR family DNA-binding domain-containing protein [Caproicibacter fermentans]|uniref:LytTR family DNA-binding domain-containing protein n=1 Tax=Caproicibacter fermentans TaxID=2576756 RepID=UPI001E63AC3C|nr:LytTR family DNA-binding domain-containing protein [Caproicibacter fermentans]